MAARYWVGTDTSWNTAANWSATSGGSGGAGVPTSADDVTFDSGSAQNCTLDVAISCASLTIDNAYSGVFDDNDFDVTVSGDVTIGNSIGVLGSGSYVFGACTWSIGGNWTSYKYPQSLSTAGVLHTLEMTGSGKTFFSYYTGSSIFVCGLFKLASGASVTNTSTYQWSTSRGALFETNTTFTHNSTSKITFADNYDGVTANITLEGTASVTGTGKINYRGRKDNDSWVDIASTATFSPSELNIEGYRCGIKPGTYDCDVVFNDYSSNRILFQSGNYVFTGDVKCTGTASAPSINHGGSLLAVNLEFRGDIIDYDLSNWVSGTGTITASGTANQDLDFAGESVEDIEINKTAGTVTLTGNVTTDSLTLTDGTLDIDGNTVTTVGGLTMAAGTTIQDTAATGSLSIGGILDINGSSGSPCTWSDADISALGTGSNDADWCTISDSNNSSGKTIDATTNCTDGTGNNGWDFGGTTQYRYQNLSYLEAQNMSVLLQI